jgi:hypothetical protein
MTAAAGRAVSKGGPSDPSADVFAIAGVLRIEERLHGSLLGPYLKTVESEDESDRTEADPHPSQPSGPSHQHQREGPILRVAGGLKPR